VRHFSIILFLISLIFNTMLNAQNKELESKDNQEEFMEYCLNCDFENIKKHISSIETKYTEESIHNYINYSLDKNRGMNPLELVSENGCPNEVLAFLLSKGALIEGDNREAKNYDKKITPLMFSIRESHWETAKFLIENGADVNATVHNQTPLRLALEKKIKTNFELARLLVKKGADINFKNTQESSLVMLSIEDETPGSAKFLLNLKNDNELNSLAGINIVLDINVQNVYGSSALSLAIENGYSEIADLIINYGDTDLELKHNRDESTAVIFAYKMNRIDIFNLLITKDVLINEQDSDLNSLLILATDKNDTNTVKKLIELGANPNLQNNDGMTALMLSVKNGNTDICQILLDAGADKNLVNKDGLSAKDYTKTKHRIVMPKKIVKELKRILRKA
jgi:uncharacterized protein